MRIYMAARFEHRPALRPIRDQLWALGHEVVSSWIDEVKQPEHMPRDTFWKKLGMKDLTEIRAADVFAIDTSVGSERGGKEVEFGFALGQFQGKVLVVVGPVINVFHTLADHQFDTWDDFLEWLTASSNPSQLHTEQ